jgi:hypothetical protein
MLDIVKIAGSIWVKAVTSLIRDYQPFIWLVVPKVAWESLPADQIRGFFMGGNMFIELKNKAWKYPRLVNPNSIESAEIDEVKKISLTDNDKYTNVFSVFS